MPEQLHPLSPAQNQFYNQVTNNNGVAIVATRIEDVRDALEREPDPPAIADTVAPSPTPSPQASDQAPTPSPSPSLPNAKEGVPAPQRYCGLNVSKDAVGSYIISFRGEGRTRRIQVGPIWTYDHANAVLERYARDNPKLKTDIVRIYHTAKQNRIHDTKQNPGSVWHRIPFFENIRSDLD
jgi:hypothetical protein